MIVLKYLALPDWISLQQNWNGGTARACLSLVSSTDHFLFFYIFGLKETSSIFTAQLFREGHQKDPNGAGCWTSLVSALHCIGRPWWEHQSIYVVSEGVSEGEKGSMRNGCKQWDL